MTTLESGAARTDLSGPELTEHLTRHAFETLQHAFADLPDETPLMPTHGGGSFCSTGSGTEHTSTLGEERATNPLLAMSDHTFMESWPATFPRTPVYFSRMREVNWAGPRLRTDIEMPRPLPPKAFADAASEPGSIVVDVRDPGSYADAHGEGALAIPFRESFPTWLGWLVPADARLLLVLGDDPLDDVVDACALVGFERFVGYLDGGVEAWRDAGLEPPEETGSADTSQGGASGRARGRFTRNFVVQATAAEWALVLLATLRTALEGTEAELVVFVHDEVVVHCPEAQADEVVAAVRGSAAKAGELLFGGTTVRFPLDVSVVECYADAA